MILMPKWTRRCIQQRIMLIIIVNKCQLRVRFGAKRVQNPYALCMSLLSFHCALHPCWLGSRSTRPARSKWKKEDLLVCIANMTDHFLSEKKLWFGASKCCDLRQRRRRKKSWSERKRQGWLAFFGDLFPISLKNQEKKRNDFVSQAAFSGIWNKQDPWRRGGWNAMRVSTHSSTVELRYPRAKLLVTRWNLSKNSRAGSGSSE